MARQRSGRGEASGTGTKSARTRARILDAAAQVLDQNGYAGTRLADIADLAAVQAPALYYYFPSRDDLVEHVVVAGQQVTIDHVTARLEALPADTPPMTRIAEAVGAHLEVVLAHSHYASATTRNADQLPEHIREHLVTGLQTYIGIWRGLIDAAAEAGELAPDLDPGAARMLVMGALNWASQWFDPASGPLEPLVATTQRFVLHGLAGGGPRRARGGGQTPALVDAR
ncbi:TetR/AcrR family transcriptional regulator [Actinomycetospora chibensis]|uniref:TetR/AcrR family transcriptional regulator n=1 Tax=Actinomycetospora chibensis TaxID=663606 RepID=A0ABV9RET6_9PSEU|nr:TetR/AcrR family transcriptional regulator [Actinomycetospora chibensis]MDD7925072.1 TetR/AcrR family transcriptional regulator [Actinomycetospora chibensis]